MDDDLDSEFHEIISDFFSTEYASPTSFLTPTTTTHTTYNPIIVDPSFTPNITSSQNMYVNDSQMVDDTIDWGFHGIANGFHPTIGASMSSYVTTTNTFIPSIHINSSQIVDTTINGYLNGMVNGFQTNNITYPNSYVNDTAPSIHINNVQAPNESFNPEPNNFVSIFSPNVVGASFVESTTSPTIPIDVHHRQNSTFQKSGLNIYPMNTENINQVLRNTGYPLNLPITQNSPLTCTNWPILTLPGYGKLPDPPVQKRDLASQFSLDTSVCTKILGESTTSKSGKSEKEFRLYRMPLNALNNDEWSWEEYGEKMPDDDDTTRTYYKCTSREDCTAKRRVERKKSDPNVITLKYTNKHNHPMPSLMNASRVSVDVASGSFEIIPPAHVVSSEENTEDDHIFEGLGMIADI